MAIFYTNKMIIQFVFPDEEGSTRSVLRSCQDHRKRSQLHRLPPTIFFGYQEEDAAWHHVVVEKEEDEEDAAWHLLESFRSRSDLGNPDSLAHCQNFPHPVRGYR